MAEAPTNSSNEDSRSVAVCHWHPDVETRLSCSRCGKGICTACLVQAPVGIRCRECGRAQPMPTYDVRPVNYVLGIGVAALLLAVGVVAWAVLDAVLAISGAYGSVSSLLAMPFGFVTGEAVSRSINRKRNPILGMAACAVVILAYLISRLISPYGFGALDVLFVGVGVWLAWLRLRP